MRALFTIFLALGLSTSAFAQPGSAPPSSVDPIPDYVAFRLFFAAVAENSSPTPAQAARQDGKLNPIHLNDVDKAVLVKAVPGFMNNLSAAQHAPQTTSPNAVLQTTLAELEAKMSRDGFQRLYTYVRFQKQNMRAVPYPVSTTAHH